MIAGTGIDIVNIKRIKKSVSKYGEKFIQKVLSDKEIEEMPKVKKEEFIAGRFAAKEALVKACGIFLNFNAVTILNDSNGKPSVVKIPVEIKNKKIHLSISHDSDYAAAFVIIEK